MNDFYLTSPIKIPLGQSVTDVADKLSRFLGVKRGSLKSVALYRQSVDARNKNDVHFVCSYVVRCDNAFVRNAKPYVPPTNLFDRLQSQNSDYLPEELGCTLKTLPLPLRQRKSCIVVGAGPSGLFLAMYLAACGVKVTVIERGSDIDSRARKVKSFFGGGEFDPQTNVQFGLGGAGTFSDGKLTTGISSPLLFTVFDTFVRFGAARNILTDALPHIGTDKLQNIVSNMRDEIVRLGGEFVFDTFVSRILVKNGKAVGVEATVSAGADSQSKIFFADCVALCCGHSARELFVSLKDIGADMQFKPFAVGLRVEHPREFINRAQYGEIFATHRDLPAASYKLTYNTDNHGCYSFCMCPGGIVVAANSEKNTVVVNGMSNSARNAENSNSALVVSVSQSDVQSYGFGDDVFSGMNFQIYLEKEAYKFGGGNYVAPYQNVADFLNGTTSSHPDVAPSYPRGVAPTNFDNLLPARICEILKQSVVAFDRKIRGFSKGVFIGVETRTSSPIKILRDVKTRQSNIAALFPVGEGAGYSGGIVSSSVDGLKTAFAIVDFLSETV